MVVGRMVVGRTAPGRMAFATRLAFVAVLAACLSFTGCNEDSPPPEETPAGDLSAEAATVSARRGLCQTPHRPTKVL